MNKYFSIHLNDTADECGSNFNNFGYCWKVVKFALRHNSSIILTCKNEVSLFWIIDLNLVTEV